MCNMCTFFKFECSGRGGRSEVAAGVGWIAGKHKNGPHGEVFVFASFPTKQWERRVTETRKHATCHVFFQFWRT